ncbi:MAG: carbohydrate ABC transporter permease [Chloroflexi bacterium]|nr:carbohydrate ABC transporter permease [Chloroflexota bacterium]
MEYTRKQRLIQKPRMTLGNIVIFTVLSLLALIIVVPFYQAIIISLETGAGFHRNPLSLYPVDFTLENYRYLIQNGGLLNGYRSTLIITALGTAWGMCVSVMAAYVFSRRDMPGRKVLFLLMLFTMFFDGGIVPTYLVMKKYGMVGSYSGVILLIGVSAFNIIVMKNGFESTPDSLEEAAKIDGANDLTIFLRVMLPLQKPLLATFTLFTIVTYWNEWFWSLLTLTSSGTQTLQLYLRSVVSAAADVTDMSTGMSTEATFAQGIKMAAVLLTIGPIMAVYPFLQKYFTKGIMVGAVKM